MQIAVVGTGYVGLVTGTCFAEPGNSVTCIDIVEEKIKKLKKGELPIYEPELDTLLHRNINEGRINFTTSLADGIKNAQVIFMALPTPPGEDGSADLSYILGAAKDIGPLLKNYTVIVNKSTVPVGTAEKVREAIEKEAKTNFDVVSNPEFLREGLAVSDFMNPNRIVIGTKSKKAKKIMSELYAPFVRSGSPLYFMDERSSEMTKYAANAFLALKISFMNEIANLCDETGANVDDIRIGIGSDERIGSKFLYPGIGYGGSCFPKDVRALHKTALDHGYTFKIIEAVTEINSLQKKVLTNKIKKYYKDNLKGKTFALWGLAFKPDTDDIREAPAIEIIDDLIAAGAKIQAFDPEANKNVRRLYGDNSNLTLVENEYDALKNADALIIATEWAEFKSPDFNKIKKLLNKSTIFDGRNIYNPTQMEDEGFEYYSIGRGKNIK
jgi:UDPglucose 6-dehydrogenase